MGFWSNLLKQLLGPKRTGSGLGEFSRKFGTSAAIEANKSKLGTQLEFAEKLVKTTIKTQIVGVLSRTPQISGPR